MLRNPQLKAVLLLAIAIGALGSSTATAKPVDQGPVALHQSSMQLAAPPNLPPARGSESATIVRAETQEAYASAYRLTPRGGNSGLGGFAAVSAPVQTAAPSAAPSSSGSGSPNPAVVAGIAAALALLGTAAGFGLRRHRQAARP